MAITVSNGAITVTITKHSLLRGNFLLFRSLSASFAEPNGVFLGNWVTRLNRCEQTLSVGAPRQKFTGNSNLGMHNKRKLEEIFLEIVALRRRINSNFLSFLSSY